MTRWFAHASTRIAALSGRYQTFLAAVAIILVWALSGPLFGFSDTWQLVINTDTTIVTFLMVFLIQNTQHRDALAVHLKLDELVRAMEAADDTIIGAEDGTDEQLAELKTYYLQLCTVQEEIKAKLAEALAARVAGEGRARAA